MKKLILIAFTLLSITINAQSTINSYTSTLRFLNSDFLQSYQAARIAVPTMTLPNSLNTYTSTVGFNNTDIAQLYQSIRGIGGAISTGTANSWNINGNAPSTNTNFIGTTNNTSLLFRTNNTQRFKIDSLGGAIFGTNSFTNTNLLTLRQSTAITGWTFLETDGTVSGADYINPSVGSNSVYAGRWVGTSSNHNLHLFTNGDGGNVPGLTLVNGVGNSVIINGWNTYTTNAHLRVTSDQFTRFIECEGPTQNNINWFVQRDATGNLINTVMNGRATIGSTVLTTTQPTLNVIGTMSVSGTSTLTGLRNNGTFSVSGGSTLTAIQNNGTLVCTGAGTLAGVLSTNSIVSTSRTAGIGYAVGSGSTVTQGTSRTTGVTINAVSGSITLFSAAGSAVYQDFTVTNSTVGINDLIVINQRSGTDRYVIEITNIAAGSFRVTFATTGGTTVEAPVFNYCIIKAATN
jgi:hypothetical protein